MGRKILRKSPWRWNFAEGHYVSGGSMQASKDLESTSNAQPSAGCCCFWFAPTANNYISQRKVRFKKYQCLQNGDARNFRAEIALKMMHAKLAAVPCKKQEEQKERDVPYTCLVTSCEAVVITYSIKTWNKSHDAPTNSRTSCLHITSKHPVDRKVNMLGTPPGNQHWATTKATLFQSWSPGCGMIWQSKNYHQKLDIYKEHPIHAPYLYIV